MQRRLCEMSEAKWSITEAKCLQISHNKYASQRDAISHSMGNLMLSHSAGMHNIDISIAGISKRFHFASLHCIFSAYLPTHIKFLTEFRCIFWTTSLRNMPKACPYVILVNLTHYRITPYEKTFATKRLKRLCGECDICGYMLLILHTFHALNLSDE